MKKRRKMIWRLFPSYLLITFLSLIAVSWYATRSLRHFYLDQTAADLKAKAHILEKQIKAYLFPLNPVLVDAVCKESGLLAATRITVILPSGKVIGDSQEEPQHMDNHANRPEIARALSGFTGTSTRYSDTFRKQMMYVAIPLRDQQKTVAVIRTSLPVTSIDAELKTIRTQIALGGLVIAILAAVISLIVSRQYARPIEEMKIGAARFANGELDHRLASMKSEEMNSLAEAMNRMAGQLDSRIKTIASQRQELETVLSSMQEGVIAVDKEKRVISVNRATARWFGSDPAKFQERSIEEVIRNQKLLQFIHRAHESENLLEDDIQVFQHGERTLNVRSSPLRDSMQMRIGTLVVFNDVTQLRRLENMRRDFVANVSHEIKTPLTAIKGFVETLNQGIVDSPEEAGRFLGIIDRHVNRLNSIIEDLLTLSRIEQEDGAKAIALESGNLKTVIQAAIHICRTKAEDKQVDISLSCENDLTAEMDVTLLEQAVVNLLDNAIKYSDPGGTVTVEVYQDDSEILLSVRDQGIGIAAKHQPRLFERFYRVDKARSRNLGGTGLGLAIVKHIVQAHGGTVTAESTLGKGSTFTIHLPRA